MSAEAVAESIPPGYKQTEVGVIPEDWNVRQAGEICKVNQGLQIAINNRLKLPSLNSKKYITIQYLNEGKEAEYIDTYSLAVCCTPNDILMTRTGNTGIIITNVEGVFHNNFFKINYDKKIITKEHLVNYLRLEQTQRQILIKAGTSTIPDLNHSDFYSIYIVIPPLPEQKAIASALSDTDALIESLEQLIAKKRQIKQGAMQELLTGKRRLPGFSGEWETKKLGDLGNFLKGSGIAKEESLTGTLPCIRYGEIYTKHNDYIKEFYSWISQGVASTAARLNCGDILFAGSGETKEEIGKCVAFVDKMESYAGGDIVILRPKNVDSLFLGYYLNTTPINRQKASRGQGDAIVHISSVALADINITVPSLPEQTAIATILSDMDSEITSLEEQLAKTRQIKQGMMQELLTGRIRLV